MSMSERRSSTMNSFSPREIPQQRPQKSELQLAKFATPSSFLLEDKIQNPSKFFFSDFSLGCFVMDQRSGDGRLRE